MAKVLGKGLKALIQSYGEESNISFANVPIKNIIKNKYQPRKNFSNDEMKSLIYSIKEKGIMQPLAVRKINKDQFELIAGERRLRAAFELKFSSIPVYIINIKNESEMMEYALIENIQRINLNPLEEASGYKLLKEKYNYSQEKIASSVSKSRSEVANKLRLLNLPAIIQNALKSNKINYAHARLLLSIQKQEKMIIIFNEIIKNKLSVRKTDYLINSLETFKKKKVDSTFLDDVKELNSYLNTTTKINASKKGKGYIKILFEDWKQLKKIINKIKKNV